MIERWFYYCKGEKKETTFEDIKRGEFTGSVRPPLIVCDKCCNIPVTHIVEKEFTEEE